MIAIIDYEAGNLRSVINACSHLEKTVDIVSDPKKLENADKIILPGVGNFGDAMSQLGKLKKVILDRISDGAPFLGICLGIQLILEGSDEARGINGLSIIRGNCSRFPKTLKVPHMGWNDIRIIKKCPILKGVKSGTCMYFVHSYYPIPKDKEVIAATTEYGIEFSSVIYRDNLFATQFHPEKSGEAGLRILKNFLDL
ncbi:MAG TPA: imidazole glycerol phosphate synthase subunit HisH [Candidatus Altiarchaeales archaeon]|nr:imidazole glycerol phosphate synthase subunit HisH [Candidatus Altiarchaeales archaeon]